MDDLSKLVDSMPPLNLLLVEDGAVNREVAAAEIDARMRKLFLSLADAAESQART